MGAIGLAGLALCYIGMTWGRFSPVAYLIVCGPHKVAAVLFGLNWLYKDYLRVLPTVHTDRQQAGKGR
ncbi:MAG: hypothetical protein QHH07_07595 [Sedimentisphaerales bacterium]|jgi:hypothetical protein|nr:hypothetical protein [Sedimentisphaerales bacterium]